jgi:hypothetical protein
VLVAMNYVEIYGAVKWKCLVVGRVVRNFLAANIIVPRRAIWVLVPQLLPNQVFHAVLSVELSTARVSTHARRCAILEQLALQLCASRLAR